MGQQEEEDLYRKFSRKDLQGLCKKYGLPANKSNSEMATSLILYLEKKNISTRIIWDVSRSDPYPSAWSDLQPGVGMNSAGNKRTDLREMATHDGFGQFQKHRDSDQNDLRNGKGPGSSDKASGDMGISTQLLRDNNRGAGYPENAFSSIVSSPAEAPCPNFTYDVSNKDGIQLYVDLNSTPSDWIESLQFGVEISLGRDYKSSSSEQRKGSCLKDSHNQMNNTQLEDESYPTTVDTGVALQAVELGGEGFLSRPGLKTFTNTVHYVKDLGLGTTLLSSRSKSDSELQNCGSESLIRKENKVDIYSDASVGTQIKTYKFAGNTMPYDPACSKTGDGMCKNSRSNQTCGPPDLVLKNSRLSGAPFLGVKASASGSFIQHHDAASSSRVATCLVSDNLPRNSRVAQIGPINTVQFGGDVLQMWPGQAIERSQYAASSDFLSGLSGVGQTDHGRPPMFRKCVRHVPEYQLELVPGCEKSTPLLPLQRSSLVNLDTSNKTGSGEFKRSHETRQEALELLKKDSSLSPSNIGGPLDLVVPEKSRLDHHVLNCSNNLDEEIRQSQARNNLGSSKTGDGNESSEYLKATQSLEGPLIAPANSEFNEPKMKRHISSVDESQSGSPEMKISRTSLNFPGLAHASRRRSTRIVTKVIVHDRGGDAHDNL